MNEWEYVFGKYQAKLEDDKESSDVNIELEKKNKEADIVSKIKSEYLLQYGEEPTSTVLNELKEDYMKEVAYEDEIDEDNDLEQPKEGLEILEIGGDYGDLDQGLETEGDGISDFSMDVL